MGLEVGKLALSSMLAGSGDGEAGSDGRRRPMPEVT